MRAEYDICVIGAGAGGLSVAAGAATLGAKVVIVEKADKMGGDCLHYGCVPSKTLLHSAAVAHTLKQANALGISASPEKIEMKAINTRIDEVIAGIQPHDSVERFEKLGCEVLVNTTGAFEDKKTFGITAGAAKGEKIRAKYFVLSTGSSPFIPPIEGVENIDFLTNETVFSLQKKPKHLLIIGGGPIGVEMAQAFIRLGSKVTVIIGDSTTILSKDDPDAAAVVMQQLTKEGVEFIANARAKKATRLQDGRSQITVEYSETNTVKSLEGDAVLIATGRKANTENLGLENAGVEYERQIKTNAKLQTTNKHIYSCGDVTSQLQFTHVAGYQAGVILKNLFSPFPLFKADHSLVPWVTYTDPELAQLGLTAAAAKKQNREFVTHVFPFSGNDRARAEGATAGFIKTVCQPNGKILGVTIVGKSAGELLGTWIIALQQKLKIQDMQNTIFPYPTLGEVSKQVAGKALKASLTPWKKKLIQFLSGMGRKH